VRHLLRARRAYSLLSHSPPHLCHQITYLLSPLPEVTRLTRKNHPRDIIGRYVALSRATSLEGLELTSFDAKCIRASPTVLEFYRKHGSMTVHDADEDDDDIELEKEEWPEEKVARLQEEAVADGRFIDLTGPDDPLGGAAFSSGATSAAPFVKTEPGTAAPPVVKAEPGTAAAASDPVAMAEDPTLHLPQDELVVKPESDIAASASAPGPADCTPDSKPRTLVRKSSYVAYLERSGPQQLGQKALPVGVEGCMTGLRMVVTGVLEFMERNQAEDLVKLYGGKTQNNPAGNTDYVVAGREPGPKKMEKAAALGVPVLTETEFCTMIETRTAADAAEESPAAQRKRSKRRATTSIGGTSKQSKF
jgi:hypothetical protein